MQFTLENIVPWGRSFDEYVAMFSLSAEDLEGRILGCGDGPASFNAELSSRGGRIVSLDPLYRFSAAAIRSRIEQTATEVLEQTRRNRDEFVWTSIASVAELGRVRLAAMTHFLEDYPLGLRQGRYIPAQLPALPFADQQFDLALCSHLLFLYSDHLSAAFHVQAIGELCRVAAEVRIFPLLELGAKPSRHLDAVRDELTDSGHLVRIVPVDYEFQRGGNRMMTIMAGRGSDPVYI